MAKKKKFDPADHNLVPKHVKVSEEEKKKLIEEYGDLKDFPRIMKNDPAIKSRDFKPGDVVKIIRKTDLNDDVYYRVVVDV